MINIYSVFIVVRQCPLTFSPLSYNVLYMTKYCTISFNSALTWLFFTFKKFQKIGKIENKLNPRSKKIGVTRYCRIEWNSTVVDVDNVPCETGPADCAHIGPMYCYWLMSGHHTPCTVYDRAADNRIPLYCQALVLVKYTITGACKIPLAPVHWYSWGGEKMWWPESMPVHQMWCPVYCKKFPHHCWSTSAL